MPYNENLANRVREALENTAGVEEKKMFRGITFMVNNKMCICVSGERLMCRVGFSRQQQLAEEPGYSEVIMRGKVMKDYIYAEDKVLKDKKHFTDLVQYCLSYNNEAKSSIKKK